MNIFKGIEWLRVLAAGIFAAMFGALIFLCSMEGCGSSHQLTAALGGAGFGAAEVLGYNFGKNDWKSNVIGAFIVVVLMGLFGGLMFYAKG